MARSPVAFGLILTAAAVPAVAAEVHITNITNNPLSTATAVSNGPGNIIIDNGGAIQVVNNTQATLTLNSSNTIDNSGIIQSASSTGAAVGVHILGGFTGSFTNRGFSGSGVNVAGASGGIYGLLLDGGSAFTGDIKFVTLSGMSVSGPNATGVAIRAPLIGNLDFGANTTISGLNATGVQVLAPISGAFTNRASLLVLGTTAYTSTAVDPLSGSAIAIGAGITGGFLNAGPANSSDVSESASVTNSGTAPTLFIAPSVAGTAASSFTLGMVSDATNQNFSFINRGTFQANEADAGISTTTVRIGESGATGNTVTLDGGIYNRGNILATAETSNRVSTNASSSRADATGLEIGNGAIINGSGLASDALVNEGVRNVLGQIFAGQITATVAGDNGGTATAILIQPGAIKFASINNSGLIQGQATSTNPNITGLIAYGIRDLSGKLTTITNSGTITAGATILTNGAANTIAVDISRGTTNQSITNSGAIAGDVRFGAAGNQFVVEGSAASFSGSVFPAAGGTLDIHLSEGGTGGSFRTGNVRATSFTIGSAGAVAFNLSKNSGTAPLIATTGDTIFAAGTSIALAPSTFLPSGSYTLVHAAGALQFGDFAATTAVSLPFLFHGSITADSNDLKLTVQRKTAAELGLTGNDAAIYEPLANATLGDDQFGTALLTVGTAADVQAAVNAMVPDIAGGVRALAVSLTDQATGVIGARTRNLVTADASRRDEFRFWGQEFYNNVSDHGDATSEGFGGAGQGLSLGVEWGDLGSGRLGVGYTFFSSQETERHPRDTKINADWQMISLYGGWRLGDVFFAPQVTGGLGDIHSRRLYVVGRAPATLVRQPTASWTSYLASGGAMAGYIADIGGFQIVPHIAVDGLYLHEDAYSEVNGGGVGLSMRSQKVDSVRSFAGVMGQGNYTWDEGNLQPQVLLGWSHEFLKNPATIDGSFESLPGSPFHLTGPTLASNKLVGGASVAYVFGNWSAGVNYDASRSSGEMSQSATISLSSRF